MKIKGHAVSTTTLLPDWNETNERKSSFIENKPSIEKGADTYSTKMNKDTEAYGGGSFASGGGSVAGVSYEKFLELFGLADSESSKALYEAARARSSNNMNVSTPQDAGYRYWYAHAEGDTSKAYNRSSHAEGNHTEAHGHASHAEGATSKAIGDVSHAEGASTIATKRAAHAEGNGTHAEGEASHSEGDQTYATAIAAHAEGIRSYATASGSHAEGRSYATGQYAHSEGEDTHADGYASHAEGYGTHATQNSAHSEGHSTSATAIAAHAEGYGTKAASKYQHVQGKFNVEDNAEKYAHIVGWGAQDRPLNIHTLSTNGTAMYLGDVYANETKKLATVDEAKAAAADAVAAVVGSSKETLNTLEELGKALGEDPNFATTMATELGKKADAATMNEALAEKADADTMEEELANKVDLVEFKHPVLSHSIKGASRAQTAMKALCDSEGKVLNINYLHLNERVSVEFVEGGPTPSLPATGCYLLEFTIKAWSDSGTEDAGSWQTIVHWTKGTTLKNVASTVYVTGSGTGVGVDTITINDDGTIMKTSYDLKEMTRRYTGLASFHYRTLLDYMV